MFADRTELLDAFLNVFPEFHDGKGPEDYGRYLKPKEVEPLLEERWQPSLDDLACTVVGTKEELLEELQALVRGEIR
jgi:hypothetical protein